MPHGTASAMDWMDQISCKLFPLTQKALPSPSNSSAISADDRYSASPLTASSGGITTVMSSAAASPLGVMAFTPTLAEASRWVLPHTASAPGQLSHRSSSERIAASQTTGGSLDAIARRDAVSPLDAAYHYSLMANMQSLIYQGASDISRMARAQAMMNAARLGSGFAFDVVSPEASFHQPLKSFPVQSGLAGSQVPSSPSPQHSEPHGAAMGLTATKQLDRSHGIPEHLLQPDVRICAIRRERHNQVEFRRRRRMREYFSDLGRCNPCRLDVRCRAQVNVEVRDAQFPAKSSLFAISLGCRRPQ